MPGKVIGVSMNVGYPGSFARNSDCVIVSRLVKVVTGDTGVHFGDPVILDITNTVQAVSDFIAAPTSGTFLATLFLGVGVREVKTYQTYAANMPDVGLYAPGQSCDVLERGSVSVICSVGTPVAGGAVYIRKANGSSPSGFVLGGFEYRVDDDTGSCILLTNAFWTTGLMDANKVCEMTIVERNLP